MRPLNSFLGVEVFNKLYAGESLDIAPTPEPVAIVKEQAEVDNLDDIISVNEQFYQVKRQADEKYSILILALIMLH